FYFEDSGFGARISHRYRSKFLSEIFGLSATRTLRQAKSESVFDAQVSYEFQGGSLKGLNVTAQVLDIFNSAFTTFEQGDQRFVVDRQKFGTTFLVGASYSF
ncbi:MAG: TonB-dependent receptor, partial [Gammaproteobacteria bacterium HGW-Gammaproteobacteria-6]